MIPLLQRHWTEPIQTLAVALLKPAPLSRCCTRRGGDSAAGEPVRERQPPGEEGRVDGAILAVLVEGEQDEGYSEGTCIPLNLLLFVMTTDVDGILCFRHHLKST